MGERGPAPKRSDQRRRVNEPITGPVETGDLGEVERRPPKEDWHDIAYHWYESLTKSGQSEWYTSTDWDVAYALAESMSREFAPQRVKVGEDRYEMMELPIKAQSLQAWFKGFASLLCTEGDRRRAAIELQQRKTKAADEKGPSNVTSIGVARDRSG